MRCVPVVVSGESGRIQGGTADDMGMAAGIDRGNGRLYRIDAAQALWCGRLRKADRDQTGIVPFHGSGTGRFDLLFRRLALFREPHGAEPQTAGCE